MLAQFWIVVFVFSVISFTSGFLLRAAAAAAAIVGLPVDVNI